MLEIRNNAGLTLQLAAGQRLTIEINSTIFDTDDVIRGSYSYPFKFPLNENNRRFISNGHLPESPLVPDMQVQVIAGAHAFVATLTYKTSGKYADAALLIDLGELADKIRNVPVREFVTESFFIGTDETGSTPTMLKMATADPNVYPMVFPPFHNSEMVEEGFKPTANYKRPTIVNVWYPGNPLPTHSGTLNGSGDRLLVPMVYLGWLISYICTKLGFAASGTLFTDPVLSRLIIFNTQTTSGLSVDSGGYTVEIGRHLGEYSISEFFKSIRSYIGISIDINVTSRKAIFNTYKSLVATTKYLDISDAVVPGSTGVENSEKRGFQINTFSDPQDEYYRAFDIQSVNNEKNKDLRSSFTFSVGERGVKIDLSIGTLLMDRFISKEGVSTGGSFSELVGMPNPFNGAFPITGLTSGQTGYLLEFNNTTKRFKISNNMFLVGETVRQSGTASTFKIDSIDGPAWLIPAVKQKGNLADSFFAKSKNYSPYQNPNDPNTVPSATNDWELRFLVYWGLKEDSMGMFYPYASSVSYDTNYKVFGSMSLQPGEPDDIWTRHQKNYYQFLAKSKTVTVLTRLSLSQLSRINPSEPIGFKLQNFVLGRYLLENLTYELPAQSGYVMAEFSGRQVTPVILKPSTENKELIIAFWVEMRLENKTDKVGTAPFIPDAIYQPNAIREVRADIVVYVWYDGMYTLPAENSNVMANLKVTKLGLDGQERQVTTVENNVMPAFASRTVLESNYLLKEAIYRNFMSSTGVVERYWLLRREHTFNLFPGLGYRTR